MKDDIFALLNLSNEELDNYYFQRKLRGLKSRLKTKMLQRKQFKIERHKLNILEEWEDDARVDYGKIVRLGDSQQDSL